MGFELPDDEDGFLCGPHGGELDIDPIFAKTFEAAIADIRRYEPGSTDINEDALITPSLLAPGFTFAEVPCGVVLRDDAGEIVGGYLACDLVLAHQHRGRGLGMEIVVERFLRDGDLPTWYLDTPAFSPDGWRCHSRAYDWMREHPELVRQKLAHIEPPPACSTPSLAP